MADLIDREWANILYEGIKGNDKYYNNLKLVLGKQENEEVSVTQFYQDYLYEILLGKLKEDLDLELNDTHFDEKVFEVEKKFKETFEKEIQDIIDRSNNEGITLREVLDKGFGSVELTTNDGAKHYGWNAEEFDDDILNKNIRYVDWNVAPDGFRYLYLDEDLRMIDRNIYQRKVISGEER